MWEKCSALPAGVQRIILAEILINSLCIIFLWVMCHLGLCLQVTQLINLVSDRTYFYESGTWDWKTFKNFLCFFLLSYSHFFLWIGWFSQIPRSNGRKHGCSVLSKIPSLWRVHFSLSSKSLSSNVRFLKNKLFVQLGVFFQKPTSY
jgi:hypothetical protein